jgi:hypothetical protein
MVDMNYPKFENYLIRRALTMMPIWAIPLSISQARKERENVPFLQRLLRRVLLKALLLLTGSGMALKDRFIIPYGPPIPAPLLLLLLVAPPPPP